MTTQADRDHDTALMNPPYREQVDEDCSDGYAGHALDDDVYEQEESGDLFCSGCTRERIIRDIAGRFPRDLAEPTGFAKVERCDECGMYRCGCPEERE